MPNTDSEMGTDNTHSSFLIKGLKKAEEQRTVPFCSMHLRNLQLTERLLFAIVSQQAAETQFREEHMPKSVQNNCLQRKLKASIKTITRISEFFSIMTSNNTEINRISMH